MAPMGKNTDLRPGFPWDVANWKNTSSLRDHVGRCQSAARAWKAGAMSLDLALGCWRSAPLLPQYVQYADRRRRSLEASPPHLMISGASIMGALCWQLAVPAPDPNRAGFHLAIDSRRLCQPCSASEFGAVSHLYQIEVRVVEEEVVVQDDHRDRRASTEAVGVVVERMVRRVIPKYFCRGFCTGPAALWLFETSGRLRAP